MLCLNNSHHVIRAGGTCSPCQVFALLFPHVETSLEVGAVAPESKVGRDVSECSEGGYKVVLRKDTSAAPLPSFLKA